MVKTEGTYIQVAYKNVFGHISTNSWPFFMIQRLTIREKCVSKVQHITKRKTACNRSRPVFSGFSIFQQTLQLATEIFQNLCNCNWWSGLFQLGSVQFRSSFQSSKLDLQTLDMTKLVSQVIAELVNECVWGAGWFWMGVVHCGSHPHMQGVLLFLQ